MMSLPIDCVFQVSVLTNQKVKVVRRLNFELWGCKVKIPQKYGHKIDFEISHILESSVLEGFDTK